MKMLKAFFAVLCVGLLVYFSVLVLVGGYWFPALDEIQQFRDGSTALTDQERAGIEINVQKSNFLLIVIVVTGVLITGGVMAILSKPAPFIFFTLLSLVTVQNDRVLAILMQWGPLPIVLYLLVAIGLFMMLLHLYAFYSEDSGVPQLDEVYCELEESDGDDIEAHDTQLPESDHREPPSDILNYEGIISPVINEVKNRPAIRRKVQLD